MAFDIIFKIRSCLILQARILRVLNVYWRTGGITDQYRLCRHMQLKALTNFVSHDIADQFGDQRNASAKVCQCGMVKRCFKLILRDSDEILICRSVTNGINNGMIGHISTLLD